MSEIIPSIDDFKTFLCKAYDVGYKVAVPYDAENEYVARLLCASYEMTPVFKLEGVPNRIMGAGFLENVAPETKERFVTAVEKANKNTPKTISLKQGEALPYIPSKDALASKQLDDVASYTDALLNGGERPETYVKTARIKARDGKEGEVVETYILETRNTVKQNGDKVVTGIHGEEYIVDKDTFAKKYEPDPDNPAQYRPKGTPQLFIQVKEDVSFKAPWGEMMTIKAGGYLNVTDKNDIYGVAKEEFEATYGKLDTSRKQSQLQPSAVKAGILSNSNTL